MNNSAFQIAMKDMGELIEKANLVNVALQNLAIDGGDFTDTYAYPDYDAGEF